MSKGTIAAGFEQIAHNELNVYKAGYGNGYDAGRASVPEPIIEPLNVSANGTYTVTDGVDGYSPITVNVPDVNGSYDEGYSEGYEVGNTEGIELGKKSEYDAFWDAYQNYGNRQHYAYAFAGQGWTKQNFKPKYDIKVINAERMFANMNTSSEKISNLVEIFNECGVTFDTSLCTTFSYFLMYGVPDYFPVIDTRSANSLNNFSVQSNVKSIEKIILRDDGSQTITTMFAYNHNYLKDVTFEGVIGTSFNMSTCTVLSKESVESIIHHLSDTTNNLTLTLVKTAVDRICKEAEFSDRYDSTNSPWWAWLTAFKPNWTISLI